MDTKFRRKSFQSGASCYYLLQWRGVFLPQYLSTLGSEWNNLDINSFSNPLSLQRVFLHLLINAKSSLLKRNCQTISYVLKNAMLDYS